jgi:inner membrane transporter RhtA
MLLIQLGNALSVHVFDDVGPSGAAWLRMCWAALILLVAVRPRPWALTRPQLGGAAALGATTGLLLVAYAQAIARLPLGTASALEFLGPLSVALLTRAPGRAGVVLPFVAGAGVVALTEPWRGATDGVGVVLALLAACGWGTYIVLTQRVGAVLEGLTGLALSFTVAALVATPFGLADAAGRLDAGPVAQMAGIAVLTPLVPLGLEFLALRRMASAVFGILMCLEPAIGLLIGIVALDQQPRLLGVAGIALVVAAGVGAQRVAGRGRASPGSAPHP